MKLSFIDTDLYIEGRYHKRVNEIFASEGEARFREMEYNILCEVSEIEEVIIATGGGMPCFYDSMTIMNRVGTTVYLEASAEELAERLKSNRMIRPLLENRSGEDLTAFIRENLERRRPFYEQARLRFDTKQMRTEHDVKMLIERLERLVSES